MTAADAAVPLTELLNAWRAGDGHAFESVIEATYAQLRRIAEDRMYRDAGPITLAPQDVLHEAVARMLLTPPDLKNRAHFFATISLLMRGIIIDHARARIASKRGGGDARVTFTESMGGEDADVFDVLALDQALIKLAAMDARSSDVLHLTYFAGLQQHEIAALMNVSVKTIERDLRFSRAWLQEAMAGG